MGAALRMTGSSQAWLVVPPSGPAQWPGPSMPRATRADQPSDEQLMARFQSGDRLAYRLLVERYSRELLAFAARLLGDRIWAEDLTQDVFLRLYQKAHTFRAESKVATWLYRVARNACYDHLKRRKHEPRLMPTRAEDGDAAGLPDPAAVEPTPPRRLEQAELRERVEAALAALPARFREPFVLVVLQGLSYDDAARVAGCSVKTLSSRLSRARARFRRQMEPYLGVAPAASPECRDTPLPERPVSEEIP